MHPSREDAKDKDKEREKRVSAIGSLVSPRPRLQAPRVQTEHKSPIRAQPVVRRPAEAPPSSTPKPATPPTLAKSIPVHPTSSPSTPTTPALSTTPSTSARSHTRTHSETVNNMKLRPVSFSVSSFDRDELTGKKKTQLRIKTFHKTYVCCGAEKGHVEHSSNLISPEEYTWNRFDISVDNGSYTVSLRTQQGRFLSYEKGNGKLCTSKTRKHTELFIMEFLPVTKKYAIKTLSGEYLCALPDNGVFGVNRYGPQPWEQFEIEEEPFAPPLFGGNLNDIVVHQLKTGLLSQVPHILEVLAAKILNLDGHNTEGIFRISGDGTEVMSLRTEFQKGNFEVRVDNVHNAATLFKLFLRELSEPVFPQQYYSTAIRLAEEMNIHGVQEMIQKFDNINIKVIQFVGNFLIYLSNPKFVEKTMMNLSNFATVFAPTLLRCPSDNPLLQITASTAEVKFILILLENFPEELKENFMNLINHNKI